MMGKAWIDCAIPLTMLPNNCNLIFHLWRCIVTWVGQPVREASISFGFLFQMLVKITFFRTVPSQCQALSSEVLYRIYNALYAVSSIFLLFCQCTWKLWLYWACLLATECMVMSLAMLVVFKSTKSIFPIRIFLESVLLLYFVCFHTVEAKNVHCQAIVKPWITVCTNLPGSGGPYWVRFEHKLIWDEVDLACSQYRECLQFYTVLHCHQTPHPHCFSLCCCLQLDQFPYK